MGSGTGGGIGTQIKEHIPGVLEFSAPLKLLLLDDHSTLYAL